MGSSKMVRGWATHAGTPIYIRTHFLCSPQTSGWPASSSHASFKLHPQSARSRMGFVCLWSFLFSFLFYFIISRQGLSLSPDHPRNHLDQAKLKFKEINLHATIFLLLSFFSLDWPRTLKPSPPTPHPSLSL